MTDEELEYEWRNNPQLKKAALQNIGELRAALIEAHKFLISDEGRIFGFLYKQALKRGKDANNQIKKTS